jgi:hypothetical protein
MRELCVVHLVRAQNGIEPFKRFLESYRQNQGGIEHDLLIIFKGCGQSQDTAAYRELLAPFKYKPLEISDKGFDITAYFAAVNRYSENYRYFCFLNSYSVVLDRDWLRKLYENVSKPGVGLVGATGSWGSHSFTKIIYVPRITPIKKKRPFYKKLLLPFVIPVLEIIVCLREIPIRTYSRYHFEPFPNPHIRTNAFIISGELMKSLKCAPLHSKMDAYTFESGKKGLTTQILKKGKKVIVVGKDGVGYEKEDWNNSRIFWQADQENLLVADNQTRDYQEGSPERRCFLRTYAWGSNCSNKLK